MFETTNMDGKHPGEFLYIKNIQTPGPTWVSVLVLQLFFWGGHETGSGQTFSICIM